MRDPDTVFTIKQSDLPAANGIIHIIDKPITNLPADASSNIKVGTVYAINILRTLRNISILEYILYMTRKIHLF